MESRDIKTNTFDDFLKILILVPIGICIFSWIGVGTDIIVEKLYLFFKNSLIFKELFDAVSFLYSDSLNNPLIAMSDYRIKIVYMMLLFIFLPISLLFYIVISLIKKIFKKNDKQLNNENKSQQNMQ